MWQRFEKYIVLTTFQLSTIRAIQNYFSEPIPNNILLLNFKFSCSCRFNFIILLLSNFFAILKIDLCNSEPL